MSEKEIDAVAMEAEKACRQMAEPFTRFVVCAAHLRKAIAAAEERGRRAGIEEARALLREALGVIPRNNPMYLSLRGRIDAALAPRDSGKDTELRAAVERKP